MPIDAYVGKPGHGKSFGVVKHVIIPSLKQGRHVVTNIPLMVDDLLTDFGGFISQLPDDWYSRPDLADLCPPGCVLVLDELWRRWPSGLKATNVPHADKALLAEHRHRVDQKGKSMRIILVTQDLQQLAAFALTLIEQTFRMTKLTKKNYRVDIYTGAAKGERPPKAQRIRQTYGQFSEDIHRYYQSATMSQTGDVGDESKADKRGNALRSPFVWLAVLGVLYCAVSGVSGLFEYFNPSAHEGVSEPESSAPKPAELVNPMPAAAAVVAPVPASGSVKPSGPRVSETWRVAGWLGCVMPSVDSADATVRPCGAAEQGGLRVSRTSGVVLVGPGGDRRIVQMDSCWWLQRDRYVACSVDGEVANPWSGRSAANATALSMTGTQSSAAGERSDPAALDASRSSSAHASAPVDRQPVAITIVPDTEYSSRPWR